MVDWVSKKSYNIKDLEDIVRLLRGPGGCPWDAEQTHASIRRNFLEEAYEAVEAIDEEPFDSSTSETTRIAYGNSSSVGSTGIRARSARAPCPTSRRFGAPMRPTSPVQ